MEVITHDPDSQGHPSQPPTTDDIVVNCPVCIVVKVVRAALITVPEDTSARLTAIHAAKFKTLNHAERTPNMECCVLEGNAMLAPPER